MVATAKPAARRYVRLGGVLIPNGLNRGTDSQASWVKCRPRSRIRRARHQYSRGSRARRKGRGPGVQVEDGGDWWAGFWISYTGGIAHGHLQQSEPHSV